MKASDLIIGGRYYEASSAKRTDGHPVTVVAVTTRDAPQHHHWDYSWDYIREQEKTGDPYWRGAARFTVRLRRDDGLTYWTHPRYVIRPLDETPPA